MGGHKMSNAICIPRVELGGVPLVTIGCTELSKIVVRNSSHRLRSGCKPLICVDMNGQGLSLFHSNPSYRQAVLSSEIVHADGAFLVMASKVFTGKHISGRSATTDVFYAVQQDDAISSVGQYFLGGRPEILDKCVGEVKTNFPKAKVVGSCHGYFSQRDENELIESINDSGAAILWVGLGKPLEQEWVIANRERLKVGWIITCGGLFNFVAGEYKRAPVVWQNLGFEWLHRAITRPRQLMWRYLSTSPHAVFELIRHHRANDLSSVNLEWGYGPDTDIDSGDVRDDTK